MFIMANNTESAERLARPLIRLAKAHGVTTAHYDHSGEFVEVSDEVLLSILAALGIVVSNDEEISAALKNHLDEEHKRLVSPTVLQISGTETAVNINHAPSVIPEVSLTLEDGSQYGGTFAVKEGIGESYDLNGQTIENSQIILPADIPEGYHALHVRAGSEQQEAFLICVPARVDLIDPLKDGKLWGWMAQLYSIRSHDSWGTGDYSDLKFMLAEAKKNTGSDFILINPVHAGEPVAPLTPSPYLPISRRYVNFTYIRPEDIEEYASLSSESKAKIDALHDSVRENNADASFIDRNAMWNAKMPALEEIFKAGRTAERQAALDKFVSEQGEDLKAYSAWCLAYEKWGAPTGQADSWERKYDRDSEEVKQLLEENRERLDFYAWLQWIAVSQIAQAQKAAADAGMKIGIMADMAVGVHPSGAEVWWNPERFAVGATVGAPPDFFNQQGQNWSQPPLNPNYLAQSGYKFYRQMVHSMFNLAGSVRIDHVLGLFRLWWIPEGRSAADGCYVAYDSSVMLGILALEAKRANGTIVGEDLGNVPSNVAQALKSFGLMGCVIEWYTQDENGFVPPENWREYALASVTTHDMPPTAGYLNYEHVKIREQLNLLTNSVEEFMKEAKNEHDKMISMLVQNGYLDKAFSDDQDSHEQEIVESMHRALRDAPSKLQAAAITDAVGERRAQNQPGTDNEYPNWRVPLADGQENVVWLEHLFSNERLLSLAEVMRGEK